MQNKKDKDSIDNIIEKTFSHIKDIVDANTVVGSPIDMGGGLVVIPVSKISVGLISGGGTIPKSKNNDINAGSGTGFNIVPIGFVTINNSMFNFIPVGEDNFEKNLVEMFMKVFNKFTQSNYAQEDENDD